MHKEKITIQGKAELRNSKCIVESLILKWQEGVPWLLCFCLEFPPCSVTPLNQGALEVNNPIFTNFHSCELRSRDVELCHF